MVIPELVIRSRRVVTPEATRPASLHIHRGKFVGVLDFNDVPSGAPLVDVADLVVMPGLVDTHVHVNEPGRTDWEGFETATQAAAAGGVTTIIDMPLNSIPATTTVEALETKREAAAGRCHVDVGFWGGLVPDNAPELARLFEAGVFGFKCFLVPSGVEEFPHVSQDDLRTAMPVLSKLGATLLVHAELPGPIEAASQQLARAGLKTGPSRWIDRVRRWWPDRQYAEYLASRPREAENDAIRLMVELCRQFHTKVHIVHLSSADALTVLYQARAARLPMTAETCPHYLYFAADEIPDGATAFKCAPPIRERENREFLWAAVANRLIQLVVSDHSPAPPKLKRLRSGDFTRAWGGIASLQLGLSVMWTAAQRRTYGLGQLAEWMCRGPALLAGLTRKGAIAVGYDADFVVWNPEAAFRVDPSIIRHRHTLTPYQGQTLTGVVEMAYLRGNKIFQRGEALAEPLGRLLRRDRP
jgi:allantoinase